MNHRSITSKRLLAGLAVLCLVAVPLAAQERAEEVERRTQPAAPTIGPDPGMTITGTVAEIGDDHLVLDTLVGRQIVRLGDAQVPAGLNVGDRVAIDYHRTGVGVMIAQQIRPWAVGESITAVGTVVEITDQELVVRTDVGLERFPLADIQLPPGLQVGDRVTVELTRRADDVVVVEQVIVVPPEEEVAVAPPPAAPPIADPVTDTDVLPATGSSLPWLALLGFLALLAAGALRFARAA